LSIIIGNELKPVFLGPIIADFTDQITFYTINCDYDVTVFYLLNFSMRTFASNLNYGPRSYYQINPVGGGTESGGPYLVRKKSDFSSKRDAIFQFQQAS
jgi:hypothetical protein